jgi:dihydroorotate dehydrogenase electron transfer subunit
MKLRLINQDVIAPGVYRMSLEYPAPDEKVIPGQFFMLRVNQECDPLLRRPLSLHEIDTNGSIPYLKFLYQVVGKGTTILSRLNPGDEVDILGPLGRGFSLIPNMEEAILVAGGIGVAPFLELARMIHREYSDSRLLAFIGGKTAADIYTAEDLSRLGVEIRTVTEDGSLGTRGLVTESLEQYLSEPSGVKRQVFACGPWGMMHRMAQISLAYDIPCQLSLDKVMACGVGVCRGCVVQVVDPGSPQRFRNQTVCQDGPVFEAKALFLHP